MIKKESIGKKYAFSGKAIDCFFNAEFSLLDVILESEDVILITDENVFAKHATKFIGRKTIVIKAGEKYKNQKTVDDIIDQLIGLHADRNSLVVGVGGGVVTDISGFAASIYMRGIKFGFVPASILGMVDASIGGKNGVDVGIYKNLVGTINHPQFLLYDYSFLKTLPEEEWISGFAEIIKHACIRDKIMFEFLETKSLSDFQSDDRLIGKLIEENVNIKYNVVSNDEHENGERKLLNFGHTIGHAIENISGLSHGKAISVGMALACIVSEKLNGFSKDETQRIISLLTKYKLPVSVQINKQKTWEILLHDKKRFGSEMNFIVLNKIGKAEIKKIPLNELEEIFYKL
jgi:3-dehydroquinate synthase